MFGVKCDWRKLAQRLYGVDVPYKEIRKRADEMELEHIRKHGVPIKKVWFKF